MDIDFHYYATYVAACKAGFTCQEATVIATAAQYVDDSNIEHISDSVLGVVRPGSHYFIEDFVPVSTVQSIGEFVRMELNPDEWGDSFLNNLRQVWTVFHFLPGNYKNTPGMETYNGPKKWNNWSYGKDEQDSFKMLCLPNSSLVSNIINDIRQNHRNRAYSLCLIGLRMHVLADTWAHTYYTGSPAWCINDAGEEVYSIEGIEGHENKIKVNWKRVNFRDWNQKTSSIINGEVATPPSSSVNSVCYAGHGRMGHLPDYPWIVYDYQPKWAGDRTIRKNNPDYYIKAFKQMVYAMSCIHNNKPFDIATPYGPDGLVSKEDEKTVCDIMLMSLHKDRREDMNERSNVWKNSMTALKLPPIADYNAKSWLDEFKGSKSRESNYYRFNYAARLHFNFVAKALKDDICVFLDNKFSMRLQASTGDYIGSMEECVSVSGMQKEYYPRMAAEGVVLDFIMENGKTELRNGDRVRIRTTEPATGLYCYLGAWKEPGLYYYLNSTIYKENLGWIIHKVGGSSGERISYNDTIRIENCSYRGQFIERYKPLLYSTYYLTTKSEMSDDTVWTLTDITNASGAWTHDGESFKAEMSDGAISAVFNTQRNHTETFIKGVDNYLHYFYVENGAWHHDGESFKVASVTSKMRAVFSPQRKSSEVFVKGADGYLHYFYMENGAWRHDAESFKAAKVTEAISAVFSPQRKSSEVFIKGADGYLHYFYMENGAWCHDAESFKAVKVAGEISAVFAVQRNHSEVFFRGEDGYLHYFYADKGAWRHDGESFKAAKACCYGVISAVFAMQRNHSEVFFRGEDDFLHYFYVDNGAWHHDGESFKAVKVAGEISAVFAVQRNHSEVFVKGADGCLHYFYVDKGIWRHDGESFNVANVATEMSTVFAVQRNHSEVFFRGAEDGYLHYFYHAG
jgi:hypothetical protein